jgi:CRP/FNR family transcriptional regulator
MGSSAMKQSTAHMTDVLVTLPSKLASGLFSKTRTVVLNADQTLFVEGDEADGCYRLEEGLLKATISSPNGSERILAIFGPGAMVGELSLIDGGPRSASVTALRDCKLTFVSRAIFDACAQESPELCRHLVVLLARRLRDTNYALTATSFLPVKGRVASAPACARFWARRRQRSYSYSAKNQPERPCGYGRHCARKCQQGIK